MTRLQNRLSDAVRFAQLELELPLLKAQLEEVTAETAERKELRDWALLEAKNLENPGFFLRISGRAAEKLEHAQAEARQASAAYEDARQKQNVMEHTFAQKTELFRMLRESADSYQHEKNAFLQTASAEELGTLENAEIEAFRPVAIFCVRQIRAALNEAGAWLRQDLRPRYFDHETKLMEYLHLADHFSGILKGLLVYFPENSITLGASVSAPSQYVLMNASMNLGKIDRLNIAIEQSHRVQAQLEQA